MTTLLVVFCLLLSTTQGTNITYLGIPNDKNNGINNTKTLNKALANLRSGDRLVIKNQTYWLAGGVHGEDLHNVTIQLDGTLSFLPGRKGWPTHDCNEHRIPLQPKKNGTCVQEAISLSNSTHLTLTSSETSGGVIFGSGSSWWGYINYLIHGENRPRLFRLLNATDVLIEHWTFTQSPYWTATLYDIVNLEINNCHVSNRVNQVDSHDVTNLAALNTDGFDIAGKNIYIHDSSVWNQDDCFTIQPLDSTGYNAQCTENVLIERINASGLGLTVGAIHPSLGHNCIKNVTFRHAHMHHSYKGIYIKSGNSFNSKESGELSNILYENITMIEPEQVPIWIGPAQEADSKGACSLLWPSLSKNCPPPPTNLMISNITLRNILVQNPKESPGIIYGNSKRPINGVEFDNVRVNPADSKKNPWGKDFYYCKGIKQGIAKNSTFPVPPCFKQQH
jgi:polygalacturonase